MLQNAKQIAAQLNKALDDLGMPAPARERSLILSKMLHIPKQQAWGLLEGHMIPDKILLDKIIEELEIDEQTLIQNEE